MKKKSLEISLHSIRVPVTGTGLHRKSSHLLAAELIWPRVGTARKGSSLPCSLEKGLADFEGANWGRRILMRENVEGRFALGVAISENLDYEELEKFLRFWAKAALGVTAKAAGQAVGPLGELAASPLKYAAQSVAKYPGAAPLAEGVAELDADEFPETGGTRLLTVRLTAARNLVRVTRRAVSSQQPARTTRKTILKKGDDNGEVTLAITTL